MRPLLVFTPDEIRVSPVRLLPNLGVYDDGSASGIVTISGLLPEDRLSLAPGATSYRDFTLRIADGNFYLNRNGDPNGQPTGTISGGVGGTLTLNFNGITLNNGLVDAVLEKLVFSSASATPAESRTLTITSMTGGGTQVFTPLAGDFRPFDGIDVGSRSTPAFVDLDGDGRMDLVSGAFDGTLQAWRKAGDSYVALTGAANPFRDIDVGVVSAPAFVDFDGDGDGDLVVGAADGTLRAWRNDFGSFVALAGAANPFARISVFDVSAPAFADLDRDGRLDLVLGTGDGTLAVWRNTGSGYVALTGTANPLRGVDVGFNSLPSFMDLDLDGDPDLVVGEALGTVKVWRNDAAAFTELTGSNNPFAAISLGTLSAPAFGDVDGDGD
ncbi:MAG: FG-GAP-like repeat-containing protein, partial [Roseococcus sp.]